jgi:internalin A
MSVSPAPRFLHPVTASSCDSPASPHRAARPRPTFGLGWIAPLTLALLGLACEDPPVQTAPAEDQPASVAPALQAAPTPTPEATEAVAPEPKKREPIVCPPPPALSITDPELEAEIRKRAQKPEGALTRGDLTKIKTISLTKAAVELLDPCVFPLFTNLVYLYVGRGSVDDLSPIQSLTKIEDQSITNNPVSDLSALAGKKKMDRLVLSRPQVRDLSPLAGMTKLTELSLSDTPVDDVSVLAGMTKLEKVFLERTRVSDVAALRGLSKLKALHVTGSPIDNPFVGKGVKVVD